MQHVPMPFRSRNPGGGLPFVHPLAMTDVPLRPPVPMDDRHHRSLPSPPASPYDIDPRMDPRNPSAMSAPFDPRICMEGPDYFSPMGPLGRPPLGPFLPPGFDPDTMGGSPQHIDELVRRSEHTMQAVAING